MLYFSGGLSRTLSVVKYGYVVRFNGAKITTTNPISNSLPEKCSTVTVDFTTFPYLRRKSTNHNDQSGLCGTPKCGHPEMLKSGHHV